MALYVYVAAQEEYLTGAMRTSENSVKTKFAEFIFHALR